MSFIISQRHYIYWLLALGLLKQLVPKLATVFIVISLIISILLFFKVLSFSLRDSIQQLIGRRITITKEDGSIIEGEIKAFSDEKTFWVKTDQGGTEFVNIVTDKRKININQAVKTQIDYHEFINGGKRM